MPFLDISKFASESTLSKFDDWEDRISKMAKYSEFFVNEPDGSSIDCCCSPGYFSCFLTLVDDKGRKTEWSFSSMVIKFRKLEYAIKDDIVMALNRIKKGSFATYKRENVGFEYIKETDLCGKDVYSFECGILTPKYKRERTFYVDSPDREMIEKVIDSMTFELRDRAAGKIQEWWMEILLNPYHPAGKNYLHRQAEKACDF